MQPIIINNYQLDEEQTKPIFENPKYSLIIAGAGSGKTLTLIGKIKYLLENTTLKPSEICCISFTNEAVNSLQKNIFNNCQAQIPCYTFHKLALTILDEAQVDYQIIEDQFLTNVITTFFQETCFQNKNVTKMVYAYFHCRGLFKKRQLENANKNKIQKLILTFLNLFYSNNFQKDDFYHFLKKTKHSDLLIIIFTIYIIYEREKALNNYLDFHDMIKYATKLAPTIKLPFKLIIVDEFQDTSENRLALLNQIIAQTDASLCVVGDDYQSIYHFSGCNLNLFLNLKNYYPDLKTYKLQKTYRNSQELITVAGSFIMKNKKQITKNLQSPKHYQKPIKIVTFKNLKKDFSKLLNLIPPKETTFILSRNAFDLKKYTNKPLNANMRFLTVHKSKGLEADHVILLNVINDTYGFPNQVVDHPLLNLVQNEFSFPYEEERRLFYVALTRTKNDIYLVTIKGKESPFLNELKKEANVTTINL